MGPTATGKTDVAVELCDRYPFDIVSVDSALVYRYMDIGTAKPDRETLQRAPHRLVDIRDPEQAYSAGDFVRDARAAMQEIFVAGRVPLLVGGTMMYFRALIDGIANLPPGDATIRDKIDAQAEPEPEDDLDFRPAAVAASAPVSPRVAKKAAKKAAREAKLQRAFFRNYADIHSPLFPNPVVGQ